MKLKTYGKILGYATKMSYKEIPLTKENWESITHSENIVEIKFFIHGKRTHLWKYKNILVPLGLREEYSDPKIITWEELITSPLLSQ